MDSLKPRRYFTHRWVQTGCILTPCPQAVYMNRDYFSVQVKFTLEQATKV